jgi:hypothetical protein
LGNGWGMILAAGVQLLWIAVPLFFALRIFKTKDL